MKDFFLKITKKTQFIFFPIIIPEKKEIFLSEAKKFINKVVENNLNKKLNQKSKIVVNQSINIFDQLNPQNILKIGK